MLIVLPPSEGKTAPAAGEPVDPSSLSFPSLAAKRSRLLDALMALCSRPRTGPALKALGLSPGQAGEVQRNASLLAAPAAPAFEVYSGVLFERLQLASLAPSSREQVLIASALWGMVRPDDRIPAYRLSMSAKLPRVGGLAAYWRPALREALPDDGLVVDLRSGAYAAAWSPRSASVVGVRGFTERDGRRKVVSHMVKATRGEVARVLLSATSAPRDADAVASLVAASGREVELTRVGDAWSLDVIERG